MSKIVEHDKQSASAVLSQFFSNNRKLLIIISILVIAGLVGLGVFSSVSNKGKESASLIAEEIYEKYIKWHQEFDDEKKEAIEKELLEQVEDVINSNSSNYASQRALFTKAQIYQTKEEFEKAAEAYIRLQTSSPESYLASISLFNAAGCFEMVDRDEDAVKAYTLILTDYIDSSLEAPEACFNLARLAEKSNDLEEAKEFYSRITTDWPDSKWANVANNRMILLDI